MIARPYQNTIIDKVFALIEEGKMRILVNLCTGAGKTFIAKCIIEHILKTTNHSIMFCCHRQILVNQTFDKMSDLSPSVVMGTDKRLDKENRFQIVSLQTLKNRDIAEPYLLIFDEVHVGYYADIIQDVLIKYPNSRVIGLSATPVDSRGYLLENFDSYIDDIQMPDLIQAGYLVPFEVYSPISLNLSEVKVNNDDYDQVELEQVVIKEWLLQTVVSNYIKYCDSKKFIAFATTQKHGKALCEVFNHQNIKTGYIDANISQGERDAILANLKAGTIHGVVNIDVLTAGFDEPSIEAIVDAAPTRRIGKYLQKIGRGSRIYPGKTKCIYLDIGNNVETHDMPDIRRTFKFKPLISKVIDRKLNLENIEERQAMPSVINSEKLVYLRKIGKLLDKYEGKVYRNEAELQEDVNNYLSKTGLFAFRQNSGMAKFGGMLQSKLKEFLYKNGHLIQYSAMLGAFAQFASQKEYYVWFTSKSGLADNSVFYKVGSLFFGIELKMPKGHLTKHQMITLPEMIRSGILLFIAESVHDVYEIICHIENNVNTSDYGVTIKNSIYDLPERQKGLYYKHKLPLYEIKGNEELV